MVNFHVKTGKLHWKCSLEISLQQYLHAYGMLSSRGLEVDMCPKEKYSQLKLDQNVQYIFICRMGYHVYIYHVV